MMIATPLTLKQQTILNHIERAVRLERPWTTESIAHETGYGFQQVKGVRRWLGHHGLLPGQERAAIPPAPDIPRLTFGQWRERAGACMSEVRSRIEADRAERVERARLAGVEWSDAERPGWVPRQPKSNAEACRAYIAEWKKLRRRAS